MRSILLLSLALWSVETFAQTLNNDFPEITQADLEKTVYDSDTTATAAILYDQAVITLDLSWTTYRRYRRVKIFKKEGYGYGNVIVTTFAAGGLQQIKGVTYHLDPQSKKIVKTEMANSAVLKTRANKWWEKVTFILPDIAEGVIFEYSYVEKVPVRALSSWTFQHDIPVGYSECRINIGANTLPVEGYVTGSLPPPKYTAKFKTVFQRWEMENIPAFKREPFMTDESQYRCVMGFNRNDYTWSHVIGDIYTDQFVAGVIDDYYTKKLTTTVIEGLKTEEEKVRAICNYVKKEVAWNGNYFCYGDEPRNILDAKEGSSGDINLLLASMLKKAGINFVMVATRTQEQGSIIMGYPSSTQFNHIMCLVMSKDTVLLDATDRHLPYNMVPANCLANEGLVISDKDYGWISLRPVHKDKISAQAKVTLTAEGIMEGVLTITHDGYSARDVREMLSIAGKDDYVQSLAAAHHLTLSESSFSDEALDKPIKETHQAVFENKADVRGDRIYINPFLFFHLEANPFTAEKRKYPIGFDSEEERTFIGEITVPEGYIVEEIPAGKMFNISGNAARYLLNCEFRQGKIVITSKIERRKRKFQPEEYQALREFYSRVVAKNAELVVLKKIQ